MQAPILIGELELTKPITDVQLPEREDGAAYNGVQLLVRAQRMPVGYVLLAPGDLGAGAISRQVWDELGGAINGQRSRAGLPALDGLAAGGIPIEQKLADEPADGPLVTVVVCTRNRPESVMVTLRGLAAMRYRPFEVVVVDNAPSSDATKDAVLGEFGGDTRIRYVREVRPGLSCARNRGLAEATADIVAFTDDDVRVDPWWLNGIARGFRAAPGVACVTGLIATAEIGNAAQLYFHLREGWGASCERRVYDLTENRDESPLYPYAVGVFGAGANFAVSRAVLAEVGGFNEALGAGTPAAGGEDLNLFMRLILAGHRLVYEPSAVVSHVHRTDLAELSRQMRAYGSGCTAALTAIIMADARARRELPPKVISGVAHLRKRSSGVRGNPTLPSGLIKREMAGLLEGPWLYLKGRRNLRRMPKSTPVITLSAIGQPLESGASSDDLQTRQGRRP
jgi:GT2 family glycosyltransferase